MPTRDLQTYVSAEGDDFTVTVNGELMPATLVVESEASGTISLNVQAATFTNASLTVGRHAIVDVPTGGSFWYQGVPNTSGKNRTSPVKPAESPTAANTFVKIQDGGNFQVTGGTAVFTNYIGYIAVGGSDGSTGTVSVSAGTFKFTRDYALDRIVVYKNGLMDFSGTGVFVPIGVGNVIGIKNAGANPSVIYRGSALNKGNQWFTGQGDTVYDLKTNPFATTPDTFVVTATYPNEGSTAVAMQHRTTVNLTNAAVSVGKSHFVIAGGCPNGTIYNAGDEVGVLNVQNGGRVDYVGSTNTDGNYFDGLTIGYGAFSYFNYLTRLYGELNVSAGGAFTNASGSTSVGVSRGTGRICVDGGSFRHGAANRMFLVGVAGGTADCVLKDGTFSVNANDAYIGGAWTNVFRQGKYLSFWGWRPSNHSAVGTFRQEGGTATFAHRLMLGVDGSGTIEQIGSAGSFSAQTLVFSNSVFNAAAGGTAKFTFDANGARTVRVTDKLVLGANAKLVVDSSDYPMASRGVNLFTCPGGIEGTFSEVTLDGEFAKRSRLVYGASSVRLVGTFGTMLIVR